MSLPPSSTPPSRRARRDGFARVLLGFWLALYVLVVGAAPVVDALAGHGEQVVAHWEDSSDDRCPPRHDEFGCQFTSAFSVGGLLPAIETPASAPVVVRDLEAPTSADRAWDASHRAAPLTRGPPAA